MEFKKITPEMEQKLREPLPPEAVTPHPTKAYLSTIKAIYVTERFNKVFGIGGWSLETEVIDNSTKHIVIKTTFVAPEYGIRLPSYGGNDNADLGDAYKGAVTDAITKIGSMLEIGIDVFKGLNDKQKSKGQDNQPTKTQSGSELPYLNALTKDGELTKVGQQVVEALQNGSRTLAQIEAKNRLNKQEKEYLSKIKRIEQPAADEKKPVNNKTPWASVSAAKRAELIKHGEAYIRSAYMLTDEESTKLSNYFNTQKQTA